MEQEHPLQLTLKGTGTVKHPSERAILKLKAHCQGLSSPSAAAQLLTQTTIALRDMITPLCPQEEDGGTSRTRDDAPVSHYSMSRLETRESLKHSKVNDAVLETYTASAELHVKFRDFAALNSFATSVSAMDNVQVSSIDWVLTDATLLSLRGRCRKLASRDALQRAYDFAEAFAGVPDDQLSRVVLPVLVKESPYYNQSTKPQLHYGKGKRGSVTSRVELQFEPEDITVESSVEVDFQIIQRWPVPATGRE